MHDYSSVYVLLVLAEVDSMGGVVDCGVGVDTKASPRHAAIEKAQAELLQRCDVREEWRREIEFLENGGDPLDFKVSHAGSLSVQSTSITDQLAELEAKGSFAYAPSPHGDSVESSGRPGGSLSREPNIADNLLLFDGENSNIGGEKNLKFTRKRGNGGPLEQFSQIDGCHNAKEEDDSDIIRLGIKKQAYTRRNRSRSSRDSAHAGSSDLALGDSNKLTSLPSSRSDSQQGLLCGRQLEDHALCSISNSKPILNGNIVSKTSTSEDQLEVELVAVQTRPRSLDTEKGGAPEQEAEAEAEAEAVVNPSVSSYGCDDNNQESHEDPEKDRNGAAFPLSNCIRNKASSVGFLPAPLGCALDTKEIKTNEEVSCLDSSSKNGKQMSDVIMSAYMDGNANTDECSMLRTTDGSTNGDCKGHPASQDAPSGPNNSCPVEDSHPPVVGAQISVNDKPRSIHPIPDYSSIQIKDEMELCDSKIDLQREGRPPKNPGDLRLNGEVIVKSEKMQENCSGVSSYSADKAGVPSCEHANSTLSKSGCSTISEFQNGPAAHLTLAKKAHEDAILKEAQIIEANLRRAEKLPISGVFLQKPKKCHWDFVLEEMSWMANDFMQERIWKSAAATHLCNKIASSGLLKFHEENMRRKQRNIARTLAKAIMHFWHSAQVFRSSGKELIGTHGSDMCKVWKANDEDAEKEKGINAEKSENTVHILQTAVQGYAIRFLNFISSTSVLPILAEAPTTPDRTKDAGIVGMPWDDQSSEESLFYTVPPGAMYTYIESMELQSVHSKKTSNTLLEEEWELSICDSVPDGPRQDAYEEDTNENSTYYFPGATESGLPSNYANRKRKILPHTSNAGRFYAVGSDLSYEPRVEGRFRNQPVTFTEKRPSSTINVGSVPTKRVRTAARQRVASPFSAGVTGSLQMTSKTDASSGDTNSFQDDQSSPYGVSHPRRNLEVESSEGLDRQLPFDGCEISSKSKKKKKPKHLGYKNSLNLSDSGALILPGKGSLYEQKLPRDSMIRLEQRDHVKKRLESQRFESNGNLGQYGQYAQHVAKKPKLLKRLPETSPEAVATFTTSVPSPVASQMSNMSGPNKFFKMHKDRGRKIKGMKMAAGQSGSGNPWSNFEEQALVVLVHDMGTNWELISDAINSTLQFKRVYRTPSECKERHKFLMESGADGADSAEDSGSSQQYRSTLPGIPKGSARQLFQRLQAPVEEDTLKAHFEKIISIGQKLHSFRSLINIQEMEKITPPHSSHVVALSQVCPNNLNRAVLTPLDLCEAITSSSDALTHGYQGSQTNSLQNPSHQSSNTLVIPTSGGSTMLQGSPSLVLTNSLPSPSRSLSGPTRDTQRYGMPRPASLPADDQHRMQQYNQMISGRNIQQPSMSVPGTLSSGGDRSVRMLPGANGMMCTMNRGLPVTRPGFQGMNTPGMINMSSSGSMLSGNGVVPTNVHPSAVTGPGSSMLRSRDTSQIPRPGQNAEEHRQMMMQEVQLQVSQGNCQSVAPFSGMSAPFSNAAVPPPVQAFPVQQHQQSHQQQPHILGNPNNPHNHASNHSSPQQQAYAIRIAKERHLQQRMVPQPQHPYTGSNTVSSLPNSSQIQQQVQSSSPGNSIPSSHAQIKQQQMPRNAQSGNGMSNPMMKHRQRQQVQHQQPRPQQQQRQIPQQVKIMKGVGRGATLMHQNLSVEGSQASGLSTAPKNQVSEKHSVQQSQGLFPGNSVLNSSMPPSINQQKMYPRPLPQQPKQMPPMPPDISNQGSTQVPPVHTLLASHQPMVPSSVPSASQQQQRQANHSQPNMHRMAVHQNRQMNSDSRIPPATETHVNQIIPAASTPQCTDSSAPVVSSGIQWRPEPLYDTSTLAPSAHLTSSPQENLVGVETLMSSSNQALGQRQFSGSLPLHKQGIGGQWQQQQQPQQQQAQLQHRQGGAQVNFYARSSNSGPG